MNQLIINLLQDKIDEYSFSTKHYLNSYDEYSCDIRYKQLAFIELKARSEYKRALKEYKKQCEEIWRHKYTKQVKEWKEHPDKFIEEIYGFKLLPYQKFMLKMMWNRKRE